MSRTPEEQQRLEYRRQQIVNRAIETAENVIFNGSDGSTEETNFLTAEVARRMTAKALHPFHSYILRKDQKA